MLRRYIVFVPNWYDARGGWNDVLCEIGDDHRRFLGMGDTMSFDTVEEAIMAATQVVKELSCETCFHVVDLQTGKIVVSCELKQELSRTIARPARISAGFNFIPTPTQPQFLVPS